MEELLGLSEGDRHVRAIWPTEWFESFFDYFDYNGMVHPRAQLSTISNEEWGRLVVVVSLMQEALHDTPNEMTDNELIATGWPERIAPVAKNALTVFMQRGRFSEELEEIEPSSPEQWP